MTTITISNSPLKLPRNKFADWDDLFSLFQEKFPEKISSWLKAHPSEEHNEWDGVVRSFEDLDFRELREDELTPEIIAEVEKARNTPVSEMIRIL